MTKVLCDVYTFIDFLDYFEQGQNLSSFIKDAAPARVVPKNIVGLFIKRLVIVLLAIVLYEFHVSVSIT
jgi:hypothetical protein